MVKRDGEWYAHFVLKKEVELIDEPETIISVDVGEWNVAVAVAAAKYNPSKPLKGQFWSGAKIRYIRGKYPHTRRNLQRKKRLDLVKRIGRKEERIINQILHTIVKEVVEYAKQFSKPIIIMERLNGIREEMNSSAKLNRRLHAWSFRKLQQYIEYKANLEVYLSCMLIQRILRRDVTDVGMLPEKLKVGSLGVLSVVCSTIVT